MGRIEKNIIKSFLYGIVVFFVFAGILGSIFNGDFGELAVVGISVISTMVFCTYTIVDTIKEYSGE